MTKKFRWKSDKLEGVFPSGILTPNGVFYPCYTYQHISIEQDLLERDFDNEEECKCRPWSGHTCRTARGSISHGPPPGKPVEHDPECLGPYYGHHSAQCLRDSGYLHIAGDIYLYNAKTKKQHDVLLDYYLAWKKKLEADGSPIALKNIRRLEKFFKEWEETH